MADIAVEIGDLLRQKGLTLGTVESATGGLIAHIVTAVSGSSDYFKGSIVSYSNEIKNRTIGVKAGTLEQYGAVSPQVAEEMAIGGKKLLKILLPFSCIQNMATSGFIRGFYL